jgi:hypothetical protein
LLRWDKEDLKKDVMLRHPVDGSQWRKIERDYPDFAGDTKFGLSTDGMYLLLGFGADNKNLFPTEPQISQIYLFSNAVTINKDSDTYPRRPIMGITPPHMR